MSDSAALGIFWPDDTGRRSQADGQLSARETTLIDFFWHYAWPDQLAAKGDGLRTRKDYLKSLDYWARFTGNPPVAAITRRTLSQFVCRLAAVCNPRSGKRLSRNTIYKHWVNCERLIRWTGPAGRQNREGAGLVDVTAWIKGPAKQKTSPRPAPTLEQIDCWLDHLPRTARPITRIGRVDPVVWWRALILLDYNTALRPESLFAVRWEMISGRVLEIPAAHYKGHDQDHRLWLNDPALEAIAPLRQSAGLVFRWENWPQAETTFRKHRRRTQKLAGIEPFSLYGLRRRFATELGRINPLAAQIAMGHRGLGMQMMIDHYIDRESLLSDALSRLPQPGGLVQRELF